MDLLATFIISLIDQFKKIFSNFIKNILIKFTLLPSTTYKATIS